MSGRILILRPQPGADETAVRARALGLESTVAPLFVVRALAWEPPDPSAFDAVILTSANAARLGGGGLTPFLALPCYAVGERTAEAALEAGFADVRTGPADGEALLQMMAAEGVRRAFHPSGRDRLDLAHPRVAVAPLRIYAAEAVDRLPLEAERAIGAGALVLVHSPRAASLFAALAGPLRARISLAAISAAAAEAAGAGWKALAVAPSPRDQALLELAAKLCQNGVADRRPDG